MKNLYKNRRKPLLLFLQVQKYIKCCVIFNENPTLTQLLQTFQLQGW